MKVENLATFLTVALHEFCHFTACKLLKVKVLNVQVEGKGKTRITTEDANRLQEFIVKVFPHVFDLLFGMYYHKGYFRVLWLKFWLRTRRHSAQYLVCELLS